MAYRDLPERFHTKVKVNKKTGCFEWQAFLDSDGYGQFRYAQRYPGLYPKAHRVAYAAEHGLIPEGLTIDHLCRNPCCVNPKHLECVSPGENTLRGNSVSGINKRKTHCFRGHVLTGNNLRRKGKRRICRTCDNEYQRRKYREKKEKRVQTSQTLC